MRNALGRGAELVGRVCLLLFLGSLWSVLRAAEEPAGWLAPSAFGGGLTGLAVKLASVGAAAATTPLTWTTCSTYGVHDQQRKPRRGHA